MYRSLHRLRAATIGTLLTGALVSASAQATIVERVVAVVGERPLLLSELRARAKPYSKQLAGTSANERAAANSELYSTMLQRMVDEELLRRAAAKAHISVTNEEINGAIERVAKGNNVTREELMAEITRSGVSQSQYRKELRRQLLDAKVMNLRLQGRIRVSEEDLQGEYDEVVAQERAQLPVKIAAIRLAIPAGSDAAALSKLRAHAKALAVQAKAGADFAALSRAHSTDAATRDSGGELPMLPPSQMAQELSAAVSQLEVGAISTPLLSGNSLVVIKVLERAPSQLAGIELLRPQLEQRIQMQKMEKARRAWLDSLRKTTHVKLKL